MATAKMAIAGSEAVAIGNVAYLDIETGNPPKEQLAQMMDKFDAEWEAPGNIKDMAKIEARKAADREKFLDGLALEAEAPVRVCAILTEERMYQFHSCKREKPRYEANKAVHVEGFAEEGDMMEAVCALLAETVTPETLLVGHNILSFDLPKVRLAMVRNCIPLPEQLQLRIAEEDVRQPVFDAMVHYARKFLGQMGPPFVKQHAMLVQMGIRPVGSSDIDGSLIPKWLDEGKLEAVLLKNRADMLDLRKAFERMTGRG